MNDLFRANSTGTVLLFWQRLWPSVTSVRVCVNKNQLTSCRLLPEESGSFALSGSFFYEMVIFAVLWTSFQLPAVTSQDHGGLLLNISALNVTSQEFTPPHRNCRVTCNAMLSQYFADDNGITNQCVQKKNNNMPPKLQTAGVMYVCTAIWFQFHKLW